MNTNVGQLLKELREKKGLSQNQLADKVHISRSVIAKYETGEREPSFNNLIILSKYFKIPITDLIPLYEASIKSPNTKDILNFLLKQNKCFKIIVSTLIVILLVTTVSALIYINVINHVSTNIYKITTLKSNSIIKDGLLIKTKDKVYLSLVNNTENEDIKKLKLYYLEDDEKIYITETSEINYLNFYIDLNDDDEYFDHVDYEYFFENSYLEVCYKDNTSKSIKLTYEFDYTNNSLEGNVEEITTEETTTVSNIELSRGVYSIRNNQYSELYNIAMPFMENNNFETFKVKLKGKNYKVSIINNMLIVRHNKNKIVYSVIDKNENLTLSKNNKKYKELYSYSITNDLCEGTHCYRANDDIKLVSNLVEKIKK